MGVFDGEFRYGIDIVVQDRGEPLFARTGIIIEAVWGKLEVCLNNCFRFFSNLAVRFVSALLSQLYANIVSKNY